MRRALWLLCSLLSASVWAQDPAPAKSSPPAPAATKETPSKERAKPAATSDKPAAAKDQPAAAADAKKPAKDASGTPQRFIPSEQVRSDFDVSFPVDI